MDEKHDVKTEEKLPKQENGNRSSKKLFFIMIGVLVLSALVVVFLLRHKNTKMVDVPTSPNVPTSPYTLTPADITTAAGVAQSFTVTYPVSGGWQNISDASIYIAGGHHDQWVRYNPATKSFTLKGANGNCTAGKPATLSTNYFILNCGASSASDSGGKPIITFSLTPLPSSSGVRYVINTIVIDKTKKGSGGIGGNWTVK